MLYDSSREVCNHIVCLVDVSQVTSDVANLSAKLESLTEQYDRFEERAAERLQTAKEEAFRNLRRARRQMEADEKQVSHGLISHVHLQLRVICGWVVWS